MRARLLALTFLLLAGGVPAGGALADAAAPRPATGDSRRVLVTAVRDSITPVIADQLDEGVHRAEAGDYEAYVVELDTPGGLDTSMREIVQRFLAADVPVVVYVTPSGARAASAGAIITLSANIAAMAPGTVIGAATPVGIEGDDAERKIVNDAAALAETIAEQRGRDIEFAVDAVRKGRSIPASEAVRVGAVDLRASSLGELLDTIDGRVVEVASGERVLRTADAAVERYDLGLFRRILQFLADPNLAFLLLSIGTLGLIYELATPGVGFGGAVGIVCLVLALFALSVLPVNVTGLLLLVLAAGLFVAEVVAPGFAGFAVGGAITLGLSGVFLFRDASGAEVGLEVVAPVAVIVGGAVILAGRLALRSRSAPLAGGSGTLVGRVVELDRPGDERAQVFVEGAWWNARTTGEPLRNAPKARVVDVDGLTLLVEPLDDAHARDHVGDEATGGRDE